MPSETRNPPLRSWRDRVRQIALFEALGILCVTPLFAWASGTAMGSSAALLAVLSLIASCWNGLYNTLFDRIEGRITGRAADRRPQHLRILQALGMESGLLLLTLPVVMAWTGLALLPALLADLGLAAVYVAFAWGFNLAYDRLFPIDPDSGEKRPPSCGS